MTFNTGNPLGSADPRDLYDNASNLDEAVNGDASSFTDRLGKLRPTLKGAIDPTGLASAAAGSAQRAETAADAATVNADVYSDVVSGLSDTSNGEQFQVVSGLEIVRYRNESGSAVEMARYPASEFVRIALDVASQPGLVSGEFYAAADDDEQTVYSITDEDGNVLASWNRQGEMDAAPSLDMAEKSQRARGEFHTADDQPAFALTDEQGHALLAWSSEGNLLTGAEKAGSSGRALMPYVQAGELRAVGADDVLAAELGPYTALSVAPGGPSHVRAVLDWPSLSSTRSVAAGSGWLVSDSDKVLHVIIGLGQSLMTGATSQDSMVSIVPMFPDEALMFDAGPESDVRMGLNTFYQDYETLDPDTLVGFIPLVAKIGYGGSNGETPMEATVNEVTAQAAEIGVKFRSLSFNVANGSMNYAGIKKGTQPYENMLMALSKAKFLAEDLGWKIIVDACLVKHGEADTRNTSYADNLIEWQSDITADAKAITGQQSDVHFIIGQPSSTTGGTESIKAMLEIHNSSQFHHLSGPDYPFLDRFTDYLHFDGLGYALIGEQMARAWKQAMWSSKGKSDITQIVGASRSGTTVTVQYSVPVPPLVFDTASISERDVKGFRFADSNGDVGVVSAIISDDGASTGTAEVTLELGNEPSGTGEAVLYAMSTQTNPRTESAIPRGNVRDSSDEVSRYDGRRLYNWAVHQRFELA
jgi:hypothetical protein